MTADPTEPNPAPADDATPDDTVAGQPDDAEEAPAFENRAARRARGKSAAQPPPAGKGHPGGGRGSVQGPRQWGNRRSG
jgi:hypothetical protein